MNAETEAIIDCNLMLLAALGYEKHEIIASNVAVLYHGDHRDAKDAARREFAATGEVRDAELALRRKDGSKLDVSLNVTSLRDADGRVVRARAVWRDISAHKRADRDRRFLSEFSDLLRSENDPHEAMARVSERLAQQLKVPRCLFAEVDPKRDVIIVRRDYHGHLQSIRGNHRIPSGRVLVSLSWQGGGQLRLAVSDDGVGLPEGFDVERCDSLGMQHVAALARQLQTRIAVEPGRGARFAMTLPVADERGRWLPG